MLACNLQSILNVQSQNISFISFYKLNEMSAYLVVSKMLFTLKNNLKNGLINCFQTIVRREMRDFRHF